jgi:hypothetical protein
LPLATFCLIKGNNLNVGRPPSVLKAAHYCDEDKDMEVRVCRLTSVVLRAVFARKSIVQCYNKSDKPDAWNCSVLYRILLWPPMAILNGGINERATLARVYMAGIEGKSS